MSQADFAELVVDAPAERVRRITLHRPPVNALGTALAGELQRAAESVALDPQVSCVVLAATGKAFCAGADLKERAGKTDDEVLAHNGAIRAAVEAVAAIPVPTIASIHAPALGGGFELALACDLRIAADGATVGLPECALAILPGAGGTQRLTWLAGPAVAARWVFGARALPVSMALADGLVDEIVPAEALDEAALGRARDIARCGPVALRAAKEAIRAALFAGSVADGLAAERAAYLLTLRTHDRREAIAAFNEKRAPRFEGR